MEKYIQLPATDSRGFAAVEAVRFPAPGLQMEKTASLKFAALEPEMRDFIAELRPTEGKLYVLVNALGAYEFWGPNYNADAFRESVLANSDPANGYKTFMKATVFRHHKNKDAAGDGYGKVVVSVYNPRMHRVELLLEIDRVRAELLGHKDLLDCLDSGGNPAVSMGMRTSYDECSWCGHRSYKGDGSDKCKDLLPLRLGGNGSKLAVREDGVVCCMFNAKFVAFDISFVDIGADAQGFAIAKVARKEGTGAVVQSGSRSVAKLAEIIKRIPAMSDFANSDPLIGMRELTEMGRHPLPSVLSATARAGIVLKPDEYQWLRLQGAGKGGLASQLHAQGQVIGPCPCDQESRVSIPREDPGNLLMRLVASLMPSRSIYEPMLNREQPAPRSVTIIRFGSSPVTDTLSREYDGYRSSLLGTMPLFAKEASLDPRLAPMLCPDWLFTPGSGVSKVAGLGPKSITLLGAFPIAYLFNRLFQKEGETGVMSFVGQHPIIASSFLLGLLRSV